MAIDFRMGTKILKNLQASMAPATSINPYPYVGVVKNNLDPTRCGRVQIYIPELGGNPDDQANWRTVSYASPFMGYTSTEIRSADIPDSKNAFGDVSHTYGMWMVPPDIGVEVICIFVAGDPMRGYWIACVNSNLSRYMLPGLAGSRNVDASDASANALASYTSGNTVPVVEFNENVSQNITNSNFYNAPKPIHEIQYAVLKNQGLEQDNTRGTISSSSQRETPSQVFGISTPGRPTNDPADDPTYLSRLTAGTLTEDYYRVKSRKGGHTFVMDDGSVLGTDQLVRLRTAGGHQILMHDTEETIYIGQSQGNSWIELTKDGSINAYSHNGFNLRSEGDINFHSDGNINLNADNHINLHAAKISNVAATYSLPDTVFDSNTGTWISLDNQITSVATVVPAHEPFNRITVANTAALGGSIFVDTNQLITANTILTNYIDYSIAVTNAAWTANASSQETKINTLLANATAQQSTINNLSGNAVAQQSQINDLSGNATTQQSEINNLTANVSNIVSLTSRTTVSASANVVLANTSANITVNGFKGYALYNITTSSNAWITVYSSISTRNSDAGRMFGNTANVNTGVIADAITTANITYIFTPAVYGYNDELVPDANIQLRIYNNTPLTSNITVTLTLVKLEA